MKKILATIMMLIVVSLSPALASSKLPDGMFGIKLGSNIKDYEAKAYDDDLSNALTILENLHGVVPPKKVSFLQRYYVESRNGQIHSIAGEADFSTKEEAFMCQAKVEKILKDKYGIILTKLDIHVGSISGDNYFTSEYEDANITITIDIWPFPSKYRLTIVIGDKALEAQYLHDINTADISAF